MEGRCRSGRSLRSGGPWWIWFESGRGLAPGGWLRAGRGNGKIHAKVVKQTRKKRPVFKD
jgi:hypothetical protein